VYLTAVSAEIVGGTPMAPPASSLAKSHFCRDCGLFQPGSFSLRYAVIYSSKVAFFLSGC
jgi:hypothetical protein